MKNIYIYAMILGIVGIVFLIEAPPSFLTTVEVEETCVRKEYCDGNKRMFQDSDCDTMVLEECNCGCVETDEGTRCEECVNQLKFVSDLMGVKDRTGRGEEFEISVDVENENEFSEGECTFTAGYSRDSVYFNGDEVKRVSVTAKAPEPSDGSLNMIEEEVWEYYYEKHEVTLKKTDTCEGDWVGGVKEKSETTRIVRNCDDSWCSGRGGNCGTLYCVSDYDCSVKNDARPNGANCDSNIDCCSSNCVEGVCRSNPTKYSGDLKVDVK